MGSIQVLKRQEVIVAEQIGWLRARELVKDKGGLPSHVLHDDLLVRRWPTLSEPEREKFKAYYPAWARELLVYPPKGSQFKRGKDVVDCLRDNAGREWLFPAFLIPEEAVGREKVGLFVDPASIEVNDKNVVVLANSQSITVLSPFIQNSGQSGIVDERTRVPLGMIQRISENFNDDQRRNLCRIDGTGIRPLVRDVSGRSSVIAGYGHDAMYGVGYVGVESAYLEVRVTREDDCRLIVEGTKEQLDAAVRLLGH